MKSLFFSAKVLPAKLRVLEQQGMAVTRRLDGLKKINQEPENWTYKGKLEDCRYGEYWFQYNKRTGSSLEIRNAYPKCPYRIGEVVYIKEAWCNSCLEDGEEGPCYKADCGETDLLCDVKWRSPLFMPASAARHFVKVTDVRVERLQAITDRDAIKEGVVVEGRPELNELSRGKFRMVFASLWDSISPEYPWEMNCWVWRIAFKKTERPELEEER